MPRQLLEKLDLQVGDSLEVKLVGKKAEIVPKKQIFLDALKEIQKAFRESGVPLQEILDDIDEQRKRDAERRSAL